MCAKIIGGWGNCWSERFGDRSVSYRVENHVQRARRRNLTKRRQLRCWQGLDPLQFYDLLIADCMQSRDRPEVSIAAGVAAEVVARTKVGQHQKDNTVKRASERES